MILKTGDVIILIVGKNYSEDSTKKPDPEPAENQVVRSSHLNSGGKRVGRLCVPVFGQKPNEFSRSHMGQGPKVLRQGVLPARGFQRSDEAEGRQPWQPA